jgi:hypothetical protein
MVLIALALALALAHDTSDRHMHPTKMKYRKLSKDSSRTLR